MILIENGKIERMNTLETKLLLTIVGIKNVKTLRSLIFTILDYPFWFYVLINIYLILECPEFGGQILLIS